ncbi:MAG: hypothetical protein LRY47_01795 [Seleniivibrio sp.]|nr:hypothetical protein [Seleniivibrio sp.]MCD8552646.1 hypothetical protein [Seleniivibrio sp.]
MPCGNKQSKQTEFKENNSQIIQSHVEAVNKCRSHECRAKVFPLLYQMSSVIAESSDLSHTLIILRRIMKREMKMVCGMICLCHQRTGRIFIHDSFGLTEAEESKVYMTWARASRVRLPRPESLSCCPA